MLESLTQWVQDAVSAHGIAAVFGLMVLESACIPIPSEVTMIFAGFLVSQGHMGFLEAVLAGSFGNLVGSWLAWAVGLYGVDSLLVRSRRSRRHLDEATRWFDRYGS